MVDRYAAAVHEDRVAGFFTRGVEDSCALEGGDAAFDAAGRYGHRTALAFCERVDDRGVGHRHPTGIYGHRTALAFCERADDRGVVVIVTQPPSRRTAPPCHAAVESAIDALISDSSHPGRQRNLVRKSSG
eukprot:4570702-Prymnesium_polylepis.2